MPCIMSEYIVTACVFSSAGKQQRKGWTVVKREFDQHRPLCVHGAWVCMRPGQEDMLNPRKR